MMCRQAISFFTIFTLYYSLIGALFFQTAEGATSNGSWSSWYPLGAQVDEGPEVIKDSQGRFNIFVVADDRSLYYRSQDTSAQENGNDTWSKWGHLGGILAGKPSLVQDSKGRLCVFVLGNDSSIYYKTQYSSASQNGTDQWSDWQGLGGVMEREPTVILDSDGRLSVFIVAGDGSLYYKTQSFPNQEGSGEWSGWNGLGGELESRPSVISDNKGKIHILVRGSDRALYYNQLTLSGELYQPLGWNSVGGRVRGEPSLVADDAGNIHALARGSDNGLYYRPLVASSGQVQSSPWYKLGGAIVADPTGILDPEGKLNVFVVANDSSLYYRTHESPAKGKGGGKWVEWNGLGGALEGEPEAVIDSQGRLTIFALGVDGDVYKKYKISR